MPGLNNFASLEQLDRSSSLCVLSKAPHGIQMFSIHRKLPLNRRLLCRIDETGSEIGIAATLTRDFAADAVEFS